MSPISIREFQPDDVRGVVRVQSQHSTWFEEGVFSESVILNSASRTDFRFFVAELDSQVVGFSGVLFFETVGRAELGPVCVDNDFLNQGIGAGLVEKIVDFLKQKSIHRVIARVKDKNERSLNFFLTQGFVKEATLHNYTKDGEGAIQLVRFL